MYYVIVCPDRQCRGVTIKNKKKETATCSKCDNRENFNKYKNAYSTDVKENAIAARTQILSKMGDSIDFEDIQDMEFNPEEVIENDEDMPEGTGFDVSKTNSSDES